MQVTQEGDLLFDYWSLARRRIKFILAVGAVAAAVGLGVSFKLPKMYAAHTSVFALESSGMASALGQLPLAALGLSAPSNPADYLVAILESDTVMEHIADKYNLRSNPAFIGRIDLTRDELLKALGEQTDVRTDGDKVKIVVETRSPRLSADIANEYEQQLDKSIYRFSRRKREFLQAQSTEQKAALEQAQEALRDYQTSQHAVALDAQATELVKAIAALKARRIENQIELQQNETALKTAGGIDDLVKLRMDKEMLQRKVADIDGALAEQEARLVRMPATMTTLSRLTLEVASRQAVVDMLQTNYESALLNERDEQARYQVLDHAVPPDRHSRPRKGLNTIASGAAGLLLGLIWVAIGGPKPNERRQRGV